MYRNQPVKVSAHFIVSSTLKMHSDCFAFILMWKMSEGCDPFQTCDISQKWRHVGQNHFFRMFGTITTDVTHLKIYYWNEINQQFNLQQEYFSLRKYLNWLSLFLPFFRMVSKKLCRDSSNYNMLLILLLLGWLFEVRFLETTNKFSSRKTI